MAALRLLIVKTSSLGDVIHMLPALTDAARTCPGLVVDWLVEESFATIPAWHPAVRRVIPIAMRRWKKQWTATSTWRQIGAARASLRTEDYDLVVDAQGLLKSALWTRAARGVRCGYDSASAREPLAAPFYDRRYAVSREMHAIERNRRLLAQAIGYELDELRPDYGLTGLAARLPAPGVLLPGRYVVGLHGTSRTDKEWPVGNWKRLAGALADAGRLLVLPWGNEAERQRAEEIAAAVPGTLVLPRLGLDALAVILDRADAVVGVDTGLMHLAAGLGKPGLALYTATRPALTGVVPDRHSASSMENRESATELAADIVIADLLAKLPPA
jgi:heptosyltransferase I